MSPGLFRTPIQGEGLDQSRRNRSLPLAASEHPADRLIACRVRSGDRRERRSERAPCLARASITVSGTPSSSPRAVGSIDIDCTTSSSCRPYRSVPLPSFYPDGRACPIGSAESSTRRHALHVLREALDAISHRARRLMLAYNDTFPLPHMFLYIDTAGPGVLERLADGIVRLRTASITTMRARLGRLRLFPYSRRRRRCHVRDTRPSGQRHGDLRSR